MANSRPEAVATARPPGVDVRARPPVTVAPVDAAAVAEAMSSGKVQKVDAAAVEAAMSSGKAKKLARAQGVINATGYTAANTIIRVWSQLPPIQSLEPDILAPYMTLQKAYNAACDAILARSLFGCKPVAGPPGRP